jgi:hypothetical protein
MFLHICLLPYFPLNAKLTMEEVLIASSKWETWKFAIVVGSSMQDAFWR